MKAILLAAITALLLSGCSIVSGASQTLATAMTVETFNSKNNQGKEDWTVAKIELDGPGQATMFAYRRDASFASKMGAASVINYYSDALLHPNEVNYIVVRYTLGSKSGQTILNNITGEPGKEYLVKVTGKDNSFKVALVDANTQEPIPFVKTITP